MAVNRPLRVYVDTSVIGGCFDPEFAEDSTRLFDLVRQGRLILVVSDAVFAELAPAPERVRNVLLEVPIESIQQVAITSEVVMLREAYLRAGIVSERWKDDATHVAAATIARVDAIASWNFKHIVKIENMKAFNQVNFVNGYGIITIVSPQEIRHEARDD